MREHVQILQMVLSVSLLDTHEHPDTHTHGKYLDKARARLTLSSRPNVPRAFQAIQNLNASGLLLHWMDLSPVS